MMEVDEEEDRCGDVKSFKENYPSPATNNPLAIPSLQFCFKLTKKLNKVEMFSSLCHVLYCCSPVWNDLILTAVLSHNYSLTL